MGKTANIISLSIVAAAVLTVSAVNIFQPNRPAVSEQEKRELTNFPSFSFEKLASGEFFSGIDSFVSDTFIFREQLIDVSRKVNTLWSADTFFGKNDDDIVFIPSKDNNTDTETGETTTVEKPDDTETKNTETPDNEPSSAENTEARKPEAGTQLTTDTGKEETGAETPISGEASTDEPETSGTTDENQPSGEATPNPDEDVSDIGDPHGVGEAEYISSGEIIYKGAVLSIPYLVESNAKYYASAVDYYQTLFPDTRISTVIAPLSSAMVDDPKLKAKITDQKKMIDTVNGYMSSDINGVNCYDTLYAHRTEYLYFKSDHHWTDRGAYYAYYAFAESVGFEPTPITDMKEVLMSSSWQGSMYSQTGDERIKDIRDEVYAYIPTKAHTMKTYNSDGSVNQYNTSILTSYKSYLGFIDGDNAYTIINVPDNPQNLTVLVFKDSYGNAFVPFLTEHYGTIIVVDPRYIYFNVYELLKDYKLTDIVFVNNLYNPNVKSYTKNLFRAVGK